MNTNGKSNSDYMVQNENFSYNITSQQFGRNIRNRRIEKKMTQAQLAEAIDISPNQLSSIETGNSKTKFDVIAKLCLVLDVTPDYLMLGCLHSNKISKDFEDLLQTLSDEKIALLYNIALLLRDNKL